MLLKTLRGPSDERVLAYLDAQVDGSGFEVYRVKNRWCYDPEEGPGNDNITDEVEHLIEVGYAKKRVYGGKVGAVITPAGRKAMKARRPKARHRT